MREGPYPLAARKHATYAMMETYMVTLEQFVGRFPDVYPTLQPMKPGILPSLYTLVVQSRDIILLDIITDLLAPVKEIRNLYEADKLAKKVFGVWGVIQCMSEFTVSLFG
jgi:hypothetical protein